MIPRFPALTVVAVLLVAPALAGAQTSDNKPKDVKKLALTFDRFDVDSTECGVDGGRLTDALGREAKAGPIRFDGSVYVFQVPMATLAQPAICFASADISLYRFDKERLTGDKRDPHAKVTIWENGRIRGSGAKTCGRDAARAWLSL